MIYLDYATNCPVDLGVLEVFNEVSRKYIANPNSSHKLGREAKELIESTTEGILQDLGFVDGEIVYTSGATEANNLAIFGTADKNKNKGKHIITSNLEHLSVLTAFLRLSELGYEVDYVDINPDGKIDLEHLKTLIRKDTVLISIAYIDSEIGIVQNIQDIAKLKGDCVLHVDASQAIGKIVPDWLGADLVSISPHKFYGLNGIGMLIKNKNIELTPMIYGGNSISNYRSGTPSLALIASTGKAVKIVPNLNHVENLNKMLRDGLSKYEKVFINTPTGNTSYILNISVKGTKNFTSVLEEKEIYISAKSACSNPLTMSRAVYALTKDKKLASSSMRISLSHLTTEEEIEKFLIAFGEIYGKI